MKGRFRMSSKKYPNLFSTLKVGTHTYKNRIIAAPIFCGTFISMPFLSDVIFQAYGERAKGGCAQVTVGETPVDFEYANREPFTPIDYTDFNVPEFALFKKITDGIKENNAIALIELSHCGESKMAIPGLKNPIGPVGYTREDGVEVKTMDKTLMQSVVNSFVTCARFMKEVGFDGVMIHCGHGWLPHQFLSARTNKRMDEYGGSLENRAKFPIQIIKSVRETMGKDFLIEARVSGDERAENGMGIEETTKFCKMIEGLVNIIHVSVGLYRDPVLSGMFNSSFEPHGLNADMSETIKKAVSIPVTVVGGINNPALAEQLIAAGKCDFVALGRPLSADPQFAKKTKAGKEADITPCIRCFKCLSGELEEIIDNAAAVFGCTVNPEYAYFDHKILDSKPKGSKNVLVIGGGPGGMEAAIVASDRGHKVTLVEKTDALGGLLKFTDKDSCKTDLKVFKNVLTRRVKERKIKLLMDKELTSADVASFGADAVIIAVGSNPIVPPIPGIENAMKALDVYKDTSRIGEKVVIVGGGLVGCETGLHLAKNGKDVIVIEMLDEIALDSYKFHRIALINEMNKFMKYRTGLQCTAFKHNGVTVVNKDNKKEFIPADTVVYALGMTANKEEAEKLRAAVKDIPVYAIGDCVRAAKVYDAVREGFVAGMSIL
jgi:2,4-dienoyl-CoA reductase-like NADH-dependent reductase (Old Yellow Enzyme family)/thioredoxin reductase